MSKPTTHASALDGKLRALAFSWDNGACEATLRTAAALALEEAADLSGGDKCECDTCMGVMPEGYECDLANATDAIRALAKELRDE
jgi:hypothetical protein